MKVRITQLAILVLVFGGWELAARMGWIEVILYGQPSKMLSQMSSWIMHGTDMGSLGLQIWVTVQEALLGFVIGVVLGVVCGVALGRIAFLEKVFAPFIKVMNAIPRIVLGAVFAIWFGPIAAAGKVLLVVVLVFFAVFFNAFQGTREVDRNLIANARLLGATPRKVTWDVIVPSATTWILASLHVSFGFALIGAIVGEFIGAQHGLGALIAEARGAFNPDGVYAAMIIIAAVALIAEGLISLLERRLLRWRPPAHNNHQTI